MFGLYNIFFGVPHHWLSTSVTKRNCARVCSIRINLPLAKCGQHRLSYETINVKWVTVQFQMLKLYWAEYRSSWAPSAVKKTLFLFGGTGNLSRLQSGLLCLLPKQRIYAARCCHCASEQFFRDFSDDRGAGVIRADLFLRTCATLILWETCLYPSSTLCSFKTHSLEQRGAVSKSVDSHNPSKIARL